MIKFFLQIRYMLVVIPTESRGLCLDDEESHYEISHTHFIRFEMTKHYDQILTTNKFIL